MEGALAVAVLQVAELLAQVLPLVVAVVDAGLVVEGGPVGGQAEVQHAAVHPGHRRRVAAGRGHPPHLAAAVAGRGVAAGVVAGQEVEGAAVGAPGGAPGAQAVEGEAAAHLAVPGDHPQVRVAALLALAPAALGVGDPGAVGGDRQAAQADDGEIVLGHDGVGARGGVGRQGGRRSQQQGAEQQGRSHGWFLPVGSESRLPCGGAALHYHGEKAGRSRFFRMPAGPADDPGGGPESMCGICGAAALAGPLSLPADAPERMIGVMRHRGPDEFGAWRDDRVFLGHARLSIIDLAERPAAPVQRGRRASGSPSTGRSSTTSSWRPSWRPRATSCAPAATPRSSSTPTKSGATPASTISTASSPSPCATGGGSGCCWRGTASASGPCTWPNTRGLPAVRLGDQGAARVPGLRAGPGPGGAGRGVQLLGDHSARAPPSPAWPRSRPGTWRCWRTTRPAPRRRRPCRAALRLRRYWHPEFLPEAEDRRRVSPEEGDRLARERARAPGGRGGDPPARRRAGRRVPLRRPGLVHHRGADPPLHRPPAEDVLGGLHRRGLRRDAVAAPHGRAHRHRARDRDRGRRGHRRALPRRGLAGGDAASCARRRPRCTPCRAWPTTSTSRWC